MPRRTAHWMARIALPAALVGLLTPTVLAGTALAAPAEGKPWVKLAETGGMERLYDISLAAENDGWVVGENHAKGPYAVHWDGSRLKPTDLGDLENRTVSMEAVDAVASDDVWAVSSALPNTDKEKSYIRSHWDGKKWTHDDADPPADGRTAVVRDLRAFSSDDVWVTGWESAPDKPGNRPLIEHYDGQKWTRVDLPDELTSKKFGRVVSIDGTGGDNVWIAATTSDTRPGHKPFAARWDGTKFTATELPVPAEMAEGWYPRDITVSGKNVWVTGAGEAAGQNVGYTYDGEKWTDWKNRPLLDIFDMNVDPKTGQMVAVGYQNGKQGPGDYATFDGDKWTVSPQAEDLPKGFGEVSSVDQAPESGRPMAVGFIDGETSAMHYLTSPTQ